MPMACCGICAPLAGVPSQALGDRGRAVPTACWSADAVRHRANRAELVRRGRCWCGILPMSPSTCGNDFSIECATRMAVPPVGRSQSSGLGLSPGAPGRRRRVSQGPRHAIRRGRRGPQRGAMAFPPDPNRPDSTSCQIPRVWRGNGLGSNGPVLGSPDSS